MDSFIEQFGKPRRIVSGGAKGADSLAKHYAHVRDIPFQEFEAEWSKHGPFAGPKRNQLIAKECDRMFAFSSLDELTPGTKDAVTQASGLKRWVWVNVYE